MKLGRSPYTLLVDMWTNGVSAQNCRAASSRFKRSDRIHFEIEKWNGGGPVVRRLRSGVHNHGGPKILHESENALTVADIEIAMIVEREFAQPGKSPPGVALGSKENGAEVVIYPSYAPAEFCKVSSDFRADESAGTSYQ